MCGEDEGSAMELRWRALLRRKQLDRELDAEVESHLAERAAQFEEQGMPPEEARREARKRFGRMSAHKEATRESWGWEWLIAAGRDLRYAIRVLAKNVGYTATVVLSLAIGLGASSAMFAVVYGVLLERLPFANADRIFRVYETDPRMPESGELMPVSVGMLDSLDRRMTTAEAITALTVSTATMRDGEGWPEIVRGANIDENFGKVFSVKPILGRLPDPERLYTDDHNTLLLSYSLWISRFGGDPGVLGRKVPVGEGAQDSQRLFTIIGVLPPDFAFPTRRLKDAKFWAPYREGWRGATGNFIWRNSDTFVLAKTGDGVVPVQEEISAFYTEAQKQHPQLPKLSPAVEPMRLSYAEQERVPFYLLFGASLALAALCCVNVANLLVARGLKLRTELALRRALGAPSRALLRQALTEAGLLGGLGLLGGAALGAMGIQLLRWALPESTPYSGRVGLHLEAIFFLFALVTFTVLAASASPVWMALRVRAQGFAVRSGIRAARSWGRRILLSVQVGLSLLLLCGTLLLAENLNRAINQDYGFDWSNITYASLTFASDEISTERQVASYRALAEELSGAFGNERWALVENPPIASVYDSSRIVLRDGKQTDIHRYTSRNVSPEYFSFLGLPLLAGRGFDERDGPGTPQVAVVSRAWAREFAAREDIVGMQMRLSSSEKDPWITVVGVAADSRTHTDFRENVGALYRPLAQVHSNFVNVLLRTTASPDRVEAAVRTATARAGLPKPLIKAGRQSQLVWQALETTRFFTVVFGVFSLVALILAAIGVFGVLQHAVIERRHEFGVRAAVGATRWNLETLIFRQAAAPVLLGVALGLGAAGWLSKYLESILYTVKPLEPAPYLVATLTLLTAALLAGWIPARKAGGIDPAESLRAE